MGSFSLWTTQTYTRWTFHTDQKKPQWFVVGGGVFLCFFFLGGGGGKNVSFFCEYSLMIQKPNPSVLFKLHEPHNPTVCMTRSQTGEMMELANTSSWGPWGPRVTQVVAHEDVAQHLQQTVLDVLLQLGDLGSQLSQRCRQRWTVNTDRQVGDHGLSTRTVNTDRQVGNQGLYKSC